MYQTHFGLRAEPFSIAPDPSFLFLSESHNEALAHLMYGFTHGGFVLVTGEVGTGKTTLLRNLLDRTPADVDVAFILNPRLTVKELLETLCDELGVHYGQTQPETIKQFIDALNRHLLATHQANRSTVVVIDEAQNLSPAVLEQIRLLTNLETNDKKLMRIILLGQPELADMLDRTELRQLAQRITARYHLAPLSKSEVHAYVSHRLVRAGGNPTIFTKSALNALYRLSKGTPRLINVIADRALLGAYVESRYQVTPKLVRAGAKEVFGKRPPNYRRHLSMVGIILAVVAVALSSIYWLPNVAERVNQLTESTSSQVPNEPVIHATPAEETVEATTPPATVATNPQIVTNSQQATAEVRTAREEVQNASQIGGAEPNSDGSSSPSVNNEPAPSTAVSAPVARPPGSTFTNQRRAYRALFAAWGADYPEDTQQIPCDFAPRVGLQCLSRSGGWSEIDALNSPVILELWDEQSTPYYAALLKSSAGQYELQVGETVTLSTPRDLRDQWFGTYVVLWQTPEGYNGSLRRGDNHPTVRWLAQSLKELQPGSLTGRANNIFDADLHRAVTEFQRTEGLIADGIVGPLTWIRLSDRLNLPAPKLRP